MANAQDSVQALLIEARRTQILDAATKVFAEKGFHRTTIKDVARTAGIADGTIYTYFANKADLLIGLLNRLNETEQRSGQLAQIVEGDIKSFFVAYLRYRMSTLWANAELMRAILPEMLVNTELRNLYSQQIVEPTTALAEQAFQVLIEQGQIRPIDIPLSVRAMAGMILGLLILQLLGDQQIATRWEEIPEILATMIFDGLDMSS